jgi:hypothetical protein
MEKLLLARIDQRDKLFLFVWALRVVKLSNQAAE